MLIATAGHVDHGKTVLVRALTGIDTDRLPEEKARGLSIDLGFAYRQYDDGPLIGFVDVPGHERFVRNMLAGVAAIDFALLIVAADDGPMPQTREHLAILDLLGIPRGAVAITKIDMVDSARVEAVAAEIEALVAGTALAGAPVFPLAGTTGEGVPPLEAHLLEAAASVGERAATGNFRLAIDRRFSVQGAGLVVTGAVFSGSVAVGDRLTLAPAGLPVRVRGLHAQNRSATRGRPGERCALNIAGAGLKADDVHRGDWIVAAPVHGGSRRIDARLTVLATESRPLRHDMPAHMHLGAASLTGRVALLQGRELLPGESGLAQIVLDHPTVAMHGDRFIIRDQSATRTVAGGVVIDPLGPQRGRARAPRIATLETFEGGDHDATLAALLEQSADGVDLEHFAGARNLPPDEAAKLFDTVALEEVAVRGTRVGLSSQRWSALCEAVRAKLESWHTEHPDAVGPDDRSLRTALAPVASIGLSLAAVDSLARERVVVREGGCLRLATHRPQLSAQDTALWKSVQQHVSEEMLAPPVVTELAKRLHVDKQVLDSFLIRSAGRGQLTRVVANRFFHPAAVARLAQIAQKLAGESEDGLFDAKTYRDRSGIGRNLAIQVLEFFDVRGFTRRIGDERKVVADGADIFGQVDS